MKLLNYILILSIIICLSCKQKIKNLDMDMQKAMEYYEDEKFEKAAEKFEEILIPIKRKYGVKDTNIYSKYLKYAANSYQNIKNYKKAEEYYLLAKSIYEANNATLNMEYVGTLYRLARQYFWITGEYGKAEIYYGKMLEILKITSGETSLDYANVLNDLTVFNSQLGRYEEVEIYYKQILNIIKIQLGIGHEYYANVQANLANFYIDMGYYDKAEQLLTSSLEIYNDNKISTYYCVFLGSLAVVNKNMGRYKQAEDLYKQAIEIIMELEGENSTIYAKQINNLAVLYKIMGQYERAESLSIKAIQIDSLLHGKNHNYYARDLNNLGELYKAMGRYEQAEQLYIQAIKIDSSLLGYDHPAIAKQLNNIASLYQITNRIEQAEPLFQQAIEIDEKKLHEYHPTYASHLNNLAYLYTKMAYYEESEQIMKKTFSIYKKQIETNTGFLSEKELEKFLKTFLYHLENYQSINNQRTQNNANIGDFAYDIELYRKGILLKSALDLKNRILGSQDSTLIKDYYELLSLRRRINKIITSSDKELEELDNLEEQANELEKMLTKKSKDYKLAKHESEITWKDIKQNLQSDEASIEFSSFRYFNGNESTDSIIYCAIILRHDAINPKMVFLCDESQLRKAIPESTALSDIINLSYSYPKITGNSSNQIKTLYDLVWKPVDSLLNGIETVYFSPSGLLHNISMTAITASDDNMLMDKFNLIQLSSTNLIALDKTSISISDAALYGGIVYDTDTLTLFYNAGKFNKIESPLFAYSRSYTGNNRAGFRYLSGSQIEVDSISAKLEKKGIPFASYFSTEAVEESFFSLSGNDSPSVIHISTHGFYFPDTVSVENRKNIMYSSTGEIRFRYNDDPLLRSGLLMAGANLAWKGFDIPDNLEDGILTAKEVSNMNLRNTELVVLSACQSGLGDVKGSEGVEGLQRGFKMAGVRYIIMSLWQVPDKETTEFMENFYDNWLEGDDIHKAFRNTQFTMKNIYPDDPFKWAGFVLME